MPQTWTQIWTRQRWQPVIATIFKTELMQNLNSRSRMSNIFVRPRRQPENTFYIVYSFCMKKQGWPNILSKRRMPLDVLVSSIHWRKWAQPSLKETNWWLRQRIWRSSIRGWHNWRTLASLHGPKIPYYQMHFSLLSSERNLFQTLLLNT